MTMSRFHDQMARVLQHVALDVDTYCQNLPLFRAQLLLRLYSFTFTFVVPLFKTEPF
jgi:hypothetical protein